MKAVLKDVCKIVIGFSLGYCITACVVSYKKPEQKSPLPAPAQVDQPKPITTSTTGNLTFVDGRWIEMLSTSLTVGEDIDVGKINFRLKSLEQRVSSLESEGR